jgi:hypothetical protein
VGGKQWQCHNLDRVVERHGLHEEGRRHFALPSDDARVRWGQQRGGAVVVHVGWWGEAMGAAMWRRPLLGTTWFECHCSDTAANRWAPPV